MKKLMHIIKNTLLILAMLSQVVSGQSFGQNKVQYGNFDWKFININYIH